MNIPRDTIDLHKLRHALTAARAGSFSAAAEQFSISQSALTRRVPMLEENYGIRMFDRGKSGASLTLEGARFIATAEDTLIRVQSTHDELARISAYAFAGAQLGSYRDRQRYTRYHRGRGQA
ncbi:regulatory helix-turn-helix protein, lysR family [Sphingobium faniae]|nr:regulatory helix-turn-helix protein, lysR family [Sphingobium faniae]